MPQNAYLLAKIGADTAENEQHFAEFLPIGRRVVLVVGVELELPPAERSRERCQTKFLSGNSTPLLIDRVDSTGRTARSSPCRLVDRDARHQACTQIQPCA